MITLVNIQTVNLFYSNIDLNTVARKKVLLAATKGLGNKQDRNACKILVLLKKARNQGIKYRFTVIDK